MNQKLPECQTPGVIRIPKKQRVKVNVKIEQKGKKNSPGKIPIHLQKNTWMQDNEHIPDHSK